MSDCIFCKIVGKDIPCTSVYEDDKVLAFRDIDPKAPVHILIIPKRHIESIMDIMDGDDELMAHIARVVKKLAEDLDVAQSGFRLVVNTGKDAGQTVPHLHFHMMGGRSMQWPPG